MNIHYKPLALLSACVLSIIILIITGCSSDSSSGIAAPTGYPAWTWGWNSHGQLGDGNNPTDRDAPFELTTTSDITNIVAGGFHTMALDLNGEVWVWGDNESGQLGDGLLPTDRNAPFKLTSISNVTDLSVGYGHVMALDSAGDVWVWGDNFYGQLGDGTTGPDRSAPYKLTTLSNITSIAAGSFHSMALDTNGKVWVWGWNFYGQLGDGLSPTSRNAPFNLTSISNITAIAGGDAHSLAIDTSGDLWVWGWNSHGQLGDGLSPTNRDAPHKLTTISNVTAVSGGVHTMAIDTSRNLWVWGDNAFGQLGDGNSPTDRDAPYNLTTLPNVATIDAYGYHSLAITTNGDLWAWGRNNFGQLGDGNTGVDRNTPYNLINNATPVTGIKGIAAGSYHSVALK